MELADASVRDRRAPANSFVNNAVPSLLVAVVIRPILPKKGIQTRVVKCVPYKRILREYLVLAGMANQPLLAVLVNGR